ncbi:60S ribosomal protein L29 [Trichinella papuae]|uniref:60S ribosomal protein L29 n=2 Tax=Trichinella papuae TaxID=268474 RepID=A0A0V1N7I9_9BILA|nr:60S ribosomal protein L29 [Trichinella papuae]
MAKSKNHTNHNQKQKATLIFLIASLDHKDHRNGIKRPRRQRCPGMKGVDPKFLKNLFYARKGLMKKKLEMKRSEAKPKPTEKKE